jgi:hypothetical protein
MNDLVRALCLAALATAAGCSTDSPTPPAASNSSQRIARISALLKQGEACQGTLGPALSVGGVTEDGTLQNFAELYSVPPSTYEAQGVALTDAEVQATEAATAQFDAEIFATIPAATIQSALASADALGDPCWKPYQRCNAVCRTLPSAKARALCFQGCMAAYAGCRAAGFVKKRFT